MSLRLGVMCAVFDDSSQVLLSQRGDLNTWNLPGGRLDVGERLEEAALREVEEETGVTARIERAVGLYFFDGWRRMNVLYAGTPSGGELRGKTRETRANRYFSRLSYPQKVIGVRDALASARPLPRVIATTRENLWRLRLRFGWRWLINWLTRHPEPKFPVFNVRAVAVILGESGKRVLTLPGPGYDRADSAVGFRLLPRVTCDGEIPPWDQLTQEVQRSVAVTPVFHWVGLWEDPDRGMFEFVFAATIPERGLPSAAQWTTSRNAAFSDRDIAYVERVRPSYLTDPIWTIFARDEIPDVLTVYREAKL